MASTTVAFKMVLLLVVSFTIAQKAMAADPDITSDFLLPANVTTVDGSFFMFTGMRSLIGAGSSASFKVTKASLTEFPALNGQSVSLAVLQFPAGAVNPPHTHSRSSELLLVAAGSLQVGFVDTTNKLYMQTLQTGDVFIFPKGLVDFQYNPEGQKDALAFSAFGSANAGTVNLPNTLFTTGIDDNILAKAFKTDVATVQSLKAGLAHKA